jgi:guanylate kinase
MGVTLVLVEKTVQAVDTLNSGDELTSPRIADADFDELYRQGNALITRLRATNQPRVFIISGPSGVGKDSVIEQLREHYPNARYVVTATTRPMRRGEVDGVHYMFLSKQDFINGIASDQFIEHALVYDNHYGVPRTPIDEGLAAGQHVIIKVDVKGAATLRRCISGATSIFLAPESMEELLDRLRSRKTDDHDVLLKRFRTASHELDRADEFDYVVFNEAGQLDRAITRIRSIIDTEQSRIHQPEITIRTNS